MRNKLTHSNFVGILIILCGIFFGASRADAATIGFKPSSGMYAVGDTVIVKVYISSETESTNAVSATMEYPANLLSLASVSKTGSVINLWAQEPSYSNTDGTATFQGVILNGYTGSSATVATFIFKAKAAGTANFRFSSASILANDGNGTNILSGQGTATLNIGGTSVAKAPQQQTRNTNISIAAIDNPDVAAPKKFLIISPQAVHDRIYSIQIDSFSPTIWIDDGLHVFTAPVLFGGAHTIKVSATSTAGDNLSGSLPFSAEGLKIPVITYYPKNLYADEFLVLKGVADPLVDVKIILTNVDSGAVTIGHVETNADGKFTYVPDDILPVGTYSLNAFTTDKNGFNSPSMNPLQVISNKDHWINMFVARTSKYITVIIPLVALLLLLIILCIYSIHHIKKFPERLRKNSELTKNYISGTPPPHQLPYDPQIIPEDKQ
jgi:hypothetical protein